MFSDIETPLLFLWCSHEPILHSDQDLFHYCFLFGLAFFSSWKDSSKVIKLPQTVVVADNIVVLHSSNCVSLGRNVRI